jgi:HAD superfamily hydrolase (TIGR01490 family)
MSRPFAVFDIDGTIIRWQLYHAICDAMAKQGIINKSAYDEVRKQRMNWKTRENDQAFIEYEKKLIEVFNQALTDMGVDNFHKIVKQVFDRYKDQVYTYTRDLIKELKGKDYVLFAISGSPDVIVKEMAKYYGFDDFMATSFDEADGQYKGYKYLVIGKKHQALEKLVNKHGLNYEKSYGIGDSDGDIEMLSKTENPIAFNPNQKFFEEAKSRKWPIVIERKNMIYKLMPQDEGYRLDG